MLSQPGAMMSSATSVPLRLTALATDRILLWSSLSKLFAQSAPPRPPWFDAKTAWSSSATTASGRPTPLGSEDVIVWGFLSEHSASSVTVARPPTSACSVKTHSVHDAPPTSIVRAHVRTTRFLVFARLPTARDSLQIIWIGSWASCNAMWSAPMPSVLGTFSTTKPCRRLGTTSSRTTWCWPTQTTLQVHPWRKTMKVKPSPSMRMSKSSVACQVQQSSRTHMWHS
mmetsp:Transcript_26282/g.47380  ORF Transcript_26282/g.47380 Transcript_26282/m.47380 type:complete len:227 (+) Transcript_26282:793-1473(+)